MLSQSPGLPVIGRHTFFARRVLRDIVTSESVLERALARATGLREKGSLVIRHVSGKHMRGCRFSGRAEQEGLTLTAMIYAMVAKVVRPALTSRKKVAPRI